VLVTVVVASIVCWFAYQHVAALPDVPRQEEARRKALVQRVTSPDQAWNATDYSITEGGFTTLDNGVVLVSPHDSRGKSRLVYYGPPVHISWKNGSTLVVTDDESGHVRRLNVATDRYDMRFSGPWNTAVTMATILVPAGAVALVGIGGTMLLARHKRI
jgi:hypothetical protein